jgi:hypothetical protein
MDLTKNHHWIMLEGFNCQALISQRDLRENGVEFVIQRSLFMGRKYCFWAPPIFRNILMNSDGTNGNILRGSCLSYFGGILNFAIAKGYTVMALLQVF